jgi:hypothetical protein
MYCKCYKRPGIVSTCGACKFVFSSILFITYCILSCCYNISFVLWIMGCNEMYPHNPPWVSVSWGSVAQRVDGNLKSASPRFRSRASPVLGATLMAQFNIHNLIMTKCRLLYLKTQSIPRSKHFSSRLQKSISLCCMGQMSLFVLR